MFSRRNAVKLGTANLAATLFHLPGSPNPVAVGQPSTPIAVMTSDDASESDSVTALGPAFDRPLIVKWRAHNISIPFYPPIIDDGRIYIPQRGGFITVVNASTGDLIWSEPLGTNDQVSPPIIDGDILYFSSQDRSGSSIQAVNKDSLQELWRFTPDMAGVTPVSIHDGTLYVGADRATYALNTLTGTTLWRADGTSTSSSKPTYNDNMVFTSNEGGDVFALDSATGNPLWQTYLGGHVDEPVVVGAPQVISGRVYVWGGNAYHALNAHDGSAIWRRELGDWLSTFSVSNETVYGDADGSFFALDMATGDTMWQFSSGLERNLRGHAVADDVVYISGDNIYAIDAISGLELWRHPTGETNMAHTTHIAVSDGQIISNYETSTLFALGNLEPAILQRDVILRGAPSTAGIERGTAIAGEEITNVGMRDTRAGEEWIEVTIGDVTGWILLEAIDPATLPPEGEIEYVYIP